MIGLGADVLTGRAGDTSRRHQMYGRLCGHLTMIVSAWSNQGLKPTRVSDELMVYPTNSACPPRLSVGRVDPGVWGISREQRVDLIVTQDPFSTGIIGWLLKRRFRVPLFSRNHSFFFDNPHWIAERPVLYRIFNWLGKRVIRRADWLRVVNFAEREKYLQYGIPPARVTILPTPVPLDRFFQSQQPEKLEAIERRCGLTGKRVLLWVGSVHEPVKDLDTLLRALTMVVKEVPDALLLLIGDARSAGQSKISPNVSASTNRSILRVVWSTMICPAYMRCRSYTSTLHATRGWRKSWSRQRPRPEQLFRLQCRE